MQWFEVCLYLTLPDGSTRSRLWHVRAKDAQSARDTAIRDALSMGYVKAE